MPVAAPAPTPGVNTQNTSYHSGAARACCYLVSFLFWALPLNWLSASWEREPRLHVWNKVSDHCAAFSTGLLQGPGEAMPREVRLVTKVLVTMWTIFRSWIYWCCPPDTPSRAPLTTWQLTPSSLAKHFSVGFNVFPTDASFPPYKKWPTFPLDWIPTVSSYRLSGTSPSFTRCPFSISHIPPPYFYSVYLPPTLLCPNTPPLHHS